MSSRTDSDLPFLIAGGGIGGLAMALAFARHGLPSIVFERRLTFDDDGAGIQIGPNGVRVLKTLGVADQLAPLACQPDALQIMDGFGGRAITRLPLGNVIQARHGAPYWTLHRADLHTALLSRVRSEHLISLHMAARVTTCETSAGPFVSLKLDSGAEHPGRAIIAADGLWSNLHAVSNPDLTYAGKRAFRTLISSAHLPPQLAANDTHIWMRSGFHAVHYPVRSGREIALVLITNNADAQAGWSTAVSPAALEPILDPLPPALKHLARAATAWRSWPLMTAPPRPSWTDGRIALLGDAAHPVLPFLAQGAVLALEDAVVLASCVARDSKLERAFKAYEALRQPRAQRIANASQRNGKLYQFAKPLAQVRNTILKTIPPQRLLAQYDWIYGWQMDRDGSSDATLVHNGG